MSGPKISRYTLAPREQAIFDAQNECDNNILKCIKRIQSMEAQISMIANNIITHDSYGSNENAEYAQVLKQQMKEFDERRSLLLGEFQEFSKYKRSSRMILTKTELERKNIIHKKVNSIKDGMSMLLDATKNTEKEWHKTKNRILLEIENNLNTAFEFSWDEFDEEISNKKEKAISVLNDILLQTELSSALQVKVQKALHKTNEINDDDFLGNFSVVTIKPLIEECQEYIKNMEKYGNEFTELEEEYKILCEELYITPKTFAVSKIGITKLNTEIIMLKEDVLKIREQEYIADAIDDVMKEMGYELIGSREVSKANGTSFRDELYTFGEGTAVNVRYDSHGRIAMELGGMDNADRLPSSAEVSKLENEMVAFCDKFTEFEMRLEQKGVISKDRISHLPPKAEYAQIINVSDYKIRTKAKTFKVKPRATKSEIKYRKEL